MKKKQLIALACVTLALVLAFLFWNGRAGPQPVLVFKGYEISKTDNLQFAKLEFQNMTDRSVWLYFSGEEYPLKPDFVKRPTTPNTNNQPKVVIHLHYWVNAEELPAGHNFLLNFPIGPQNSSVEVGVQYYTGNFHNSREFSDSFQTPLLIASAPLKDKIKFYWDKSKRQFHRPKPHLVWCPELLSFQTQNPTNVTK